MQLYLQFLYSGKIHVDWTSDNPGLQSHENLPEYHTLARLYVLGEKCRDVSFKNAIMDVFIRRMQESIDDRYWHPVAEVVDILYRGTMPGSPARQLMVDCHHQKAGHHWITDDPHANNKEFLIDLTRVMLRERKQTSSNPPFVTAIEKGNYHEDAEGKPVTTEK